MATEEPQIQEAGSEAAEEEQEATEPPTAIMNAAPFCFAFHYGLILIISFPFLFFCAFICVCVCFYLYVSVFNAPPNAYDTINNATWQFSWPFLVFMPSFFLGEDFGLKLQMYFRRKYQEMFTKN